MLQAVTIIGKKLLHNEACVSRAHGNQLASEKLLQVEDEANSAVFDKKAHRERYATEIEQKEIEDGLRDNPSIDMETQAAILQDYRELHQQFKDEGLYECRYSEYGKESIRYGFLFAIFAGLLYSKWYLTSAMFLGMFWVSCPHRHCNQPISR